jgi:protoporphyrinogen oxidase
MTNIIKDHSSLRRENFDVVVIGGSLPALVGALLIKKRNPEMSIVLVEGSHSLGGNLLGVDVLGQHFENGTHILQEIGDAEVDAIIRSAVDGNDLIQLDSNLGDVAGTIKDGKVWESTAYPDVFGQDSELALRIMNQIRDLKVSNLGVIKQNESFRTLDFESAATERFGVLAKDRVLLPIVQRLFGKNNDLSGFAMELCNLTRLRLVDELFWNDQIPQLELQDRVAYPDQHLLPQSYKHNKKSLYSSNRGAADFVEGLGQICRAKGIDLELNTKVLNIDMNHKSIDLESNGDKRTVSFHNLLSCVGTTATNTLVTGNKPKNGNRLKYRLVHFVLKSPMKTGVCYYYSHDASSVVFRITNYAAFSGRSNEKRVTVEVIGADSVPDQLLLKTVEMELVRSQLIEEDSIEDSICLSNLYGYPIPTVETFHQFNFDDLELKEHLQSGLVTCGLGVSGGLFFQNEILIDLISKIRSNF